MARPASPGIFLRGVDMEALGLALTSLTLGRFTGCASKLQCSRLDFDSGSQAFVDARLEITFLALAVLSIRPSPSTLWIRQFRFCTNGNISTEHRPLIRYGSIAHAVNTLAEVLF